VGASSPKAANKYNILNVNILYLPTFKKRLALKKRKIMDLFTTRFLRLAQNNNSNELN
jgi:hypothetical protein